MNAGSYAVHTIAKRCDNEVKGENSRFEACCTLATEGMPDMFKAFFKNILNMVVRQRIVNILAELFIFDEVRKPQQLQLV